MFEGPIFPFVCALKLLAVLVLLPVSAVSVVVALKVVPAKDGRQKKKANSTISSCFSRTNPPNPGSAYPSRARYSQQQKTGFFVTRVCGSLLSVRLNPYPRKALGSLMIYPSEL